MTAAVLVDIAALPWRLAVLVPFAPIVPFMSCMGVFVDTIVSSWRVAGFVPCVRSVIVDVAVLAW